jgi:hypothetical protein
MFNEEEGVAERVGRRDARAGCFKSLGDVQHDERLILNDENRPAFEAG